jgi:molecular chaperone GrpE
LFRNDLCLVILRKAAEEMNVEDQDRTVDQEGGAEADAGVVVDEEALAQEDKEQAGELTVESEDEIETLRTALEEAEARAAEYLDGWQRARAEFANYRRRQEQQRRQMQAAAKASLLLQLLPVMDDLKRALEAVPEASEGEPWVSGVEQVQRKWQTTLEQTGLAVMPVEAGEAFDPAYHEALTHEPNKEVEAGHIIQVVQPGYQVDDTVLRPALVRVSSGKPELNEEVDE